MFDCISRVICLALTIGIAQPLLANDFGEPEGPVILKVTGDLEGDKEGQTIEFDLEMLRNLDVTRIKTSTIWTEGVIVFEGVALSTFVDALGVEDGTLRATAVNDYTIDIPVSDAIEGGPILAYHLNGAPMSLREKGPIWVIYPFDSSPDYRQNTIYSRSIWQLDRIEVIR